MINWLLSNCTNSLYLEIGIQTFEIISKGELRKFPQIIGICLWKMYDKWIDEYFVLPKKYGFIKYL
jgi:hypothetical protein